MKIKIPKPLKKDKFRFIKVKNKTKRPFENNWQKSKNYKHEDPQLKNHLKKGGNYGVVCGYGKLVVIDCDQKESELAVKKHLPKTLTVKTGSGGKHYYFICNDLEKPIRLTSGNAQGDIGDVQFTGKMVVGPGSVHPSGNKYKIVNKNKIAKVKAEDIKGALSPWIKKTVREDSLDSQDYSNDLDLNITDFVSTGGFTKRGNEYQGAHPIHGSKTKMNFCVNPSKNTWYCFRHDTGGGALSWVAVKHGIISCDEAVPGALKGKKFKEVLKILEKKYDIKTETTPKKERELDAEEFKIQHIILETLSDADKKMEQKAREASEALAREFQKIYSVHTIEQDDNREMWIFEDGIYVPKGETKIKAFCRRIMGNAYKKYYLNLVLDKIEADTFIDKKKFFSEENPWLLPVKNGILDLKTRVLNDHSPEKIFFTKLPIKYDPKAGCPGLKKFIRQIIRESDIPLIQELFGFILVKDYFLHKCFMFIGDGSNGKGRLIHLIKRFVGEDNAEGIDLHELVNSPFAMANLHRKLVNLAGDISNEAIGKINILKELTGDGLVGANRKNKSYIKFNNYAKIINSANKLPQIFDDSYGTWRRWVKIPFINKFVSEKEYKKIPDSEKENVFIKRPKIVEKILEENPKELSGLLNWALNGLDRLIINEEFSTSKTVQEVERSWKRESNSFEAFCQDWIEEANMNEMISKQELKDKYSEYCRKNRLKTVGDKAIKTILGKNFRAYEKQHRTDEGRERFWHGIKLKKKKNVTGVTRRGVFPTYPNYTTTPYSEVETPVTVVTGVPNSDSSRSKNKKRYINFKVATNKNVLNPVLSVPKQEKTPKSRDICQSCGYFENNECLLNPNQDPEECNNYKKKGR